MEQMITLWDILIQNTGGYTIESNFKIEEYLQDRNSIGKNL